MGTHCDGQMRPRSDPETWTLRDRIQRNCKRALTGTGRLTLQVWLSNARLRLRRRTGDALCGDFGLLGQALDLGMGFHSRPYAAFPCALPLRRNKHSHLPRGRWRVRFPHRISSAPHHNEIIHELNKKYLGHFSTCNRDCSAVLNLNIIIYHC